MYAGPGAGRQAVPAGARVGRGLGQQAAVGGLGAGAQQFAHRRPHSLIGICFDEVLAQSIGGKEDHFFGLRRLALWQSLARQPS